MLTGSSGFVVHLRAHDAQLQRVEIARAVYHDVHAVPAGGVVWILGTPVFGCVDGSSSLHDVATPGRGRIADVVATGTSALAAVVDGSLAPLTAPAACQSP